jgi:hypothetical protein
VWAAKGCPILDKSSEVGVGFGAGAARIENARVDGRVLQVHGHYGKLEEWHRKLVAEGTRLSIQDRLIGVNGLQVEWCWQLAPGWSRGGNSEANLLFCGEHQLRVDLPESLDWHWEEHPEGLRIKANGWLPPGRRVQTRFELGNAGKS